MSKEKKVARWYFGGVSSALAVLVTHPLDLIKVHLQTQQGKSLGFVKTGVLVAKEHGFFALYNGISASSLRQLMYSFPRFGIYEMYKNHIEKSRKMKIYEQFSAAGISGFIGGICGVPADVVNVRMQNDIKLPIEKRRNYKHVFDGLEQIIKNEGFMALTSGMNMAVSRAVLLNIGQASGYDKLKSKLLATGHFSDNFITHFTSAIGAACFAILLTNPLDVMKTRLMNAPSGKYARVSDLVKEISSSGILSFYKGLIPAFVRIGPHTVIMYLIKEQLITHFGQ